MPRPKQHHYVTRAYLEGFLAPSEKQLFCYGRNRGCFQKSPNELASQRNFYAIKTEDGRWDDSLEHLIEKTVESPGLPIVKKLSEGQTPLNWQERRDFSLLVAFQEMRTPAARQQARSAAKALTDRILREVKAANPEQKSIELIGKSGESSTATLEEIAASRDDIENDHSEEIHRLAMGPALKLHGYYMRLKYTVHYASGEAKFITTDTPVIRVFQDNRRLGTGIARKDLQVRFPLSRGAFLTMTHDLRLLEALAKANEAKRAKLLEKLPEIQIRHIRDPDVLAFNKGHTRHARMWAFSSQEWDWMREILSARSAVPELMDLSSRDLYHFRSKVNYDLRTDWAK